MKLVGKAHSWYDEFVAIDVETAHGKPWSICQIGLVLVQEAEIRSEVSVLVQPPENKYNYFNIRIHGINPGMTRESPFFPGVWRQVYPMIRNRPLVAHNASFDIGCLRAALNFYSMPVPDFIYDCTLKHTRLGLRRASQAYQVKLINHHDALADARACAEIYLKLKEGSFADHSLIVEKKGTRLEDFMPVNGREPDPAHPLYKKCLLFTGELSSMTRPFAISSARARGARIKSQVSKNCHLVVVGQNPGPAKMIRIRQLQDQGHPLTLLSEAEFLQLIAK